MKRKIAIYIVLICTLLGSAPYLTGMLAQTKFIDVISLLNEVETVPATVTLLEYHRGWRKSTAKTQVTIYSDRGNKLKEYRLVFNHDIRHGPFVQLLDDNWKLWEFARAVIFSKLELSQEAEKILLAEVGQTHLLGLSGIFAINGEVKIIATGPQIKLKEHAGTDRVAFKGINGEWIISSDMKEIKGAVVLPGMDFDLEGSQLLASNLNYSTHFVKSPEGLWPGSFDAKLDKISLVLEQGKFNLSLEGFASKASMVANGATTNLLGSFHIDKATLNGKTYGPIEYSNSLNHVDTTVLKSFLTLNHQLKTGDSTASNKLTQFFISRMPDFLQRRPEFTIEKLYIHTPDGDVNGQAYIAAGGIDTNNLNIQQLLKSIVAKASLEIPKIMLKDMLLMQYSKEYEQKQATMGATDPALPPVDQSVDETLSKWLQARTLTEKEQYYVVTLEFKDGNFLINGHANQIPLPLQR